MRQVITWTPDNCTGCVLEIACDDSLPPEAVTWSLHRVVQRCEAHAALKDSEIMDELFSESRRRQYTIGFLEDLRGESFDQWHDKASWSYGPSGKTRMLRLSVADLTAVQRTQVQTWCDQNFGVGKVEIV